MLLQTVYNVHGINETIYCTHHLDDLAVLVHLTVGQKHWSPQNLADFVPVVVCCHHCLHYHHHQHHRRRLPIDCPKPVLGHYAREVFGSYSAT